MTSKMTKVKVLKADTYWIIDIKTMSKNDINRNMEFTYLLNASKFLNSRFILYIH